MKQRTFCSRHSLVSAFGRSLGASLLIGALACSSETPADGSGNVTTLPGGSSATAPPAGGGGGNVPSPPPGAGAPPAVPSTTSSTPPSPGTTDPTPPPSTPLNPPPDTGTPTETGETSSGETSSTETTSNGDTSTAETTQPDATMPNPDANPNPSGWPEPGDGGVARPAGTAGNLQVLDWAGFKGAITYSLDDCTPSQVNMIDDLIALDVPLTFYLQTNQGSACDTIANKALEAGGHELGNHTHSHEQDAGTAGGDTDQATQYIKDKYGVTPITMAAPFGNDSVYAPVAQERFFINRGVGGGLVMPLDNTSRFNLKGPAPNSGADANTMKAYVDGARDSGGWQVLTLHGFTDHSDWAYNPFPFDSLKQSVEHAKSLGDVWIGTVADIGAYWWGQKLLSDATPAASGDDQVWTWTLPDHFPPGRYLRVTVDGGTLSQGGEPLPWNDHGYYEVSLDATSLTLSP